MKNIYVAFDFDGTIAKTSHLHKLAWNMVINELDLKIHINDLLPYRENIEERYDSLGRIVSGLLKMGEILDLLKFRYSEPDVRVIAEILKNDKEKKILGLVGQAGVLELNSCIKKNINEIFELLTREKINTVVVSSSRKIYISTFLEKINIFHLFKDVFGEEDFKYGDSYIDKPDSKILEILKIKNYDKMLFYVGDNFVDTVFANNVRVPFLDIEDCELLYKIEKVIYENKNL